MFSDATASSGRRARSWFRWNPKGRWKDWRRRRLLRNAGVVADCAGSLCWLGRGSGAWPVLSESLPSKPRVWSFGIGRDLSFEVDIVTRFGARCVAFDPTPRSCEWIASQDLPPEIECVPVGLADRVGRERFTLPRPDSVNFVMTRALARDDREETIDCEVATLRALQSRHDGPIDVLKIDIEGAEYAVIDDLANSGAQQILIEFHHGMHGVSFDRTIAAIDVFRSAGYRIFWTSRRGLEIGFVAQATRPDFSGPGSN